MVDLLEAQNVTLKPDALYQMAMGFANHQNPSDGAPFGNFSGIRDRRGRRRRRWPRTSACRYVQPNAAECLCVDPIASKNGGPLWHSPLVNRYLIPGRRGYLGRFFDHFNDHMYPAWLHLEESIRTGHAQIQKVLGQQKTTFSRPSIANQHDLETFMETMEEHSLLEGKRWPKRMNFSHHHELMDVGGGTGAMDVSIVKRYPHLRVVVFDRPPFARSLNGISWCTESRVGSGHKPAIFSKDRCLARPMW